MKGYKCEACGLSFRSVSGFDDHRTGSYATHTKADGVIPSSRRCLTGEEMQQRGYVRAPNGLWRIGGWKATDHPASAARITHGDRRIAPQPVLAGAGREHDGE